MKKLLLFASLLTPLMSFSQIFINERALSEINIVEKGDYSPWISGDGLRLYYLQDADFPKPISLTYSLKGLS